MTDNIFRVVPVSRSVCYGCVIKNLKLVLSSKVAKIFTKAVKLGERRMFARVTSLWPFCLLMYPCKKNEMVFGSAFKNFKDVVPLMVNYHSR